ncbi:outer membrane protein assembly factor BamE [Pseudomonas sp. AL03]|nr:outer membrane protein assembly factor BamE [Pseudomonas sp. AL03]MDI3273435.1 outer membrane protein assembly factor BamE [Pseudomonas sp. AL03]
MSKPIGALVVVLAASSGCSTESRIYRDRPLVAKVETGMSKDQVQQIGGQPLSITDRTAEPGTCFDYKKPESLPAAPVVAVISPRP